MNKKKKLKKFDLFAAVVWQDLNFRINKSYISSSL